MKKFKVLLEILKQEDTILTQLLKLEKAKNTILIEKDYTNLISLSEQEDKLSSQLDSLETERLLFAQSENLPKNLSDIINLPINKDIQMQLENIQDTLVKKLRDLKFYNELNNKILEESINFFKATLDLLTEQSITNQTYGQNGVPESIHDQKAHSLMLDKTI